MPVSGTSIQGPGWPSENWRLQVKRKKKQQKYLRYQCFISFSVFVLFSLDTSALFLFMVFKEKKLFDYLKEFKTLIYLFEILVHIPIDYSQWV